MKSSQAIVLVIFAMLSIARCQDLGPLRASGLLDNEAAQMLAGHLLDTDVTCLKPNYGRGVPIAMCVRGGCP